MTFIRAPYIEEVSDSVEILATVNSRIVAARQGNQLVTAFHPELNDDLTVHRYFIKICGGEQLNRIID
jgi:5'-phosphate synthase pdxT subunit